MATENPRQNVVFASNGGQAHGYLALPPGGSGAGVVVIQEWWGLTDQLAGVADRLAAEGFVALAPDLYGGRTSHDAAEAKAMRDALPADQAARDLSGAVTFLLEHDAVTSASVGAIGFCMGGGFVLILANQEGDRVAAAVPFYGAGAAATADYYDLRAAVQGHYGEQDTFVTVERARALEARIRTTSDREVTFHYYPAGHAFLNENDPFGTYDPAIAALAWQRAVDFLRRHVH